MTNYYSINLESRSPYRYVAYFRPMGKTAHSLPYFSISLEVADRKWGTLLDKGIRYSIEVCEIEEPETKTCYTLLDRSYCVSGTVGNMNFVSILGKLLVQFKAIPEGTPFTVNVELEGKKHSFTQMNAGSVYAGPDLNLLSATSLYYEFSRIPLNAKCELTKDWQQFKTGTNSFTVMDWFEQSLGYPVALLSQYTNNTVGGAYWSEVNA